MQNTFPKTAQWLINSHPIFAEVAETLVARGDIPAPTSKKQAQGIILEIAKRALVESHDHGPEVWEMFAGEIHTMLNAQ